MPKFKPPFSNQKSTPGLQFSASEIFVNDNDNVHYSDLMTDYDNMRKGDPIISGLLEFLKLPILSTGWRIDYDPESQIEKEIAEFLEWTIDNLECGFKQFLYHCLLAIEYGNQIFEYVWQYNQEYNNRTINRLVTMSPIQNYTIQEYCFDYYQKLLKLRLYRYDDRGANQLVDLESNKLFIFTHNAEYGDIRGRSILRPMRKYWHYKQALIDAGTRASQRGAGIPFIQHDGNDEATVSKANQIGRTIGNMKNGYIVGEMDKIKVEFLQLQDQNNLLPLMEYADKQTFYGTLTQFMMSGIGQSGSRAATSEHKSSYELMAGYILSELEDRLNYEFIPKILKNSPYAFIDVTNIPNFKFNSITSIDIQKIVPNLVSLYNTNLITKTPDDEVMIRELVGLPEVEKSEIKVVKAPAQFEVCKHDDHKLDRKSQREMTQFEKTYFNLESANEHFETTQEKAEKLLEDFTKKIFDDMLNQFKKGTKNPSPRFKSELLSKVKRIYDDGLARGFRDVQIEISKLTSKKELMKTFANKKEISSQLLRAINRLFSDIQFTFDDQLDFYKSSLSDDKKIDDYFVGIDEGFKGRKRDIIAKTQTSYNEGRKEGMQEEGISKWVYSAILDNSVCENCSPFDNREMTLEELKQNKINLSSPVNGKCLGKSLCRCVLIPSEIGG